MPEEATGLLPDRALPDNAPETVVSSLEADASDGTKQKKSVNDPKKQKGSARGEAGAPDMVNDDQQKKKRRSTRSKAVPDVDMLDAVVSDSEPGEEGEGSDADFVARPKGSKEVREHPA